MKTAYKAYYTTAGYDWNSPDNVHDLTAYVETLEEAMEAGKTVKHDCFVTGDWWVVKETMDEATFTHTTETVYRYNWYDAVGHRNHLVRMVEVYEKEVEKAKAIKPKTEKGEQVKATKIARAEKSLAEYRAMLAKEG